MALRTTTTTNKAASAWKTLIPDPLRVHPGLSATYSLPLLQKAKVGPHSLLLHSLQRQRRPVSTATLFPTFNPDNFATIGGACSRVGPRKTAAQKTDDKKKAESGSVATTEIAKTNTGETAPLVANADAVTSPTSPEATSAVTKSASSTSLQKDSANKSAAAGGKSNPNLAAKSSQNVAAAKGSTQNLANSKNNLASKSNTGLAAGSKNNLATKSNKSLNGKTKSNSNMAPVSVTNPRPIVICGPSGTGKSTLLKRLFAEYPDHFGFSVSHTTRGPRPGEVDGKEYHFTNRLAMQGDIDAGKFIEHAEFAGNMYGTSYSAVQTVLAAMKHVILDIDVQGVQQLQAAVKGGKETGWKTAPLYIFIAPPNEAELENRLKGRGTENDESLGKRLGAAKKELEWGTTSGNVDTVVTNDVVDKAYEDLKKAIFQAQ